MNIQTPGELKIRIQVSGADEGKGCKIIRWVILVFLCLAVLVLSIDMYKEAIIYNPLKSIEISGREAANNGKKALPVLRRHGAGK